MAVHRTLDPDRAIAASGVCLQANTRNPFGRFKGEEGYDKLVPKAQDEALKELVSAWIKFAEIRHLDLLDRSVYAAARKVAKAIAKKYTAADVTRFSMVMTEKLRDMFSKDETLDEWASIRIREVGGLFISAIVNEGFDKEYELFLQGEYPLRRVGYHNVKDLTIRGGSDHQCGFEMISGNLTIVDGTKTEVRDVRGGVVYGNIGSLRVAHRDASVVFYGNARKIDCSRGKTTVIGSVGTIFVSKDANVFVRGDAYEIHRCTYKAKVFVTGGIVQSIGGPTTWGPNHITGGEIHVNGNFTINPSWAKRTSGTNLRIFHADKLVFGIDRRYLRG